MKCREKIRKEKACRIKIWERRERKHEREKRQNRKKRQNRNRGKKGTREEEEVHRIGKG